jgi:hypothetical protein
VRLHQAVDALLVLAGALVALVWGLRHV